MTLWSVRGTVSASRLGRSVATNASTGAVVIHRKRAASTKTFTTNEVEATIAKPKRPELFEQLATFGMAPRGHHFPHQLSAHPQQRASRAGDRLHPELVRWTSN